MKLHENDRYLIANSFNLMDPSPLFMLYARLCGAEAVVLYGHLLSMGKQSEGISFNSLMQGLNVNLSQLNNAFESLVTYQLLNINVQNRQEGNFYLIQMMPPLTMHQALKHDVFGRQYLKAVGAERFEQDLRSFGLNDVSLEGFQRLEGTQSKQFMQQWSEQEEAVFQSSHQSTLERTDLSFDIKAFLQACSSIVFPLNKRTEQALLSIREIGSVYGLSIKRMVELVGMAYVENEKEFNAERLRKLASKEEVDEVINPDNPYEIPPVLFLKHLRKGLEASNLEKYLLNNLVSKVGLNPVVVNVLVEGHYQHFKNKIHTKSLEETAYQWATLNVRTQRDAQTQLTKTFAQKGRRVEMVTEYATQNSPQLSEAEQEAIQEAFKKLDQ